MLCLHQLHQRLLLLLWLATETTAGILPVWHHARQVTVIEGNPQAGASRCGVQPNGAMYTCPSREPCCHPNGYCVGSDESYCYVSEACLVKFSAKSNHCQKGEPASDGGHPDDPEMPISAGRFCGHDGSDQLWGACPNVKGKRCCNSSGLCGESSDHCLVSGGCQSTFGVCWDETPVKKPPPAVKEPVQEPEPPAEDDPEQGSDPDPVDEPDPDQGEPPNEGDGRSEGRGKGGGGGQGGGGSRWGGGSGDGGSGSRDGGRIGGGGGGGGQIGGGSRGGGDRGGSWGWGDDDEGESDEWDWEDDDDDGEWWWDQAGSSPATVGYPS